MRSPVQAGKARRTVTVVLLIVSAALLAVSCLSAVPPQARPDAYRASGRETAVGPVYLPLAGLDVNNATLEELTAVSGIGPKLARAIIDEREQNGPFWYPEDMMSVSGIGRKRMEALYGVDE